jgi:outer membrane protein assembly factor BamA
MHRFLFTTVITAFSFSFSYGRTQQDERDSVITTSARVFPLPVFFYTPETGIAGGAAALYLYRDLLEERASSVTGDVIYTQKKQIIVEFAGDQYFDAGKFRLMSDVLFQKYPIKFFGIGNNTASSDEEEYTSRSFLLSAVLYRNIHSHFNVGPTIRYETISMLELKPGGLLASRRISGSNGGTTCGLGVVANWDSRDNTFAAHSGSSYQLTALFFQGTFGSDYSYADFQIDTRNFFEIVPGQVLAVQAAAEFIDGSPPFQRLVKFGGQNLLRGYFDGRYRDRDGILLQAEYRLPVWWRFGLAGFAGIAQVADGIIHLAVNRFWFAGGLGLRFFWNARERINLRLDYGIGNNSTGLYITVTEAI